MRTSRLVPEAQMSQTHQHRPHRQDVPRAAPAGGWNGEGASWWAALLLAAVALRPGEAVSEPTTVAFDVRPGGVVHSFSQNAGPGDKYTCTFTYASQGGTNESKAAFERESDVPLKNEEFEVTKTAVAMPPSKRLAEPTTLERSAAVGPALLRATRRVQGGAHWFQKSRESPWESSTECLSPCLFR
ncbi:myeloid-derived growth factor [Puma concolor]|uniref:Myeloid-derived growth factor n=1 Tax=Puma concolor TaxID=9696 RepID=A0A6P6H9C9_PUMCO|nr:myeloid-derived growth factor [Puma concolor]